MQARPEEELPIINSPSSGSRRLTLFHFVCYAFTLTAGGPFGLEPAVRSGGPLYAMIGLILVPIVYITPQVMLLTELTTMMPSNDGYVMWIDVAFGPITSYVVALMNIISNVCDLALYSQMSASYITSHFFPTLSDLYVSLAGLVPLIVGLMVSLFEIDAMAQLSGWIAVITSLPFVFSFFWNVSELRVWQLLVPARRPDPALFYSSMVWMYSGWSAIGNIGGEGKNSKVYSIGVLITIVLDMLIYLLPLLTALTVNAKGSWGNGSLGDSFEMILPHLGAVCALSCCIASFGMLVTSLACYARALSSLSERGWIPRFISRTWQNSTVPWVATVLMTLASCAVTCANLEFAMVLDVTINIFSILVILAAYGVLWKDHPTKPRPYVVPGGTCGRVLALVISSSVMLSIFVINSMSDVRVSLVYLVLLFVLSVCGYCSTRTSDRRGYLEQSLPLGRRL